jgi:2'-5' RNA ligase
MPRLFVALDPPYAVRDALAALRADVPGARWTPPEKLHLTLVFVGDVAEGRVAALAAALAGVASPPVPVAVTGLGAFPSRRGARVLTAEGALHPALSTLHLRLTAALAAAGVTLEAKPFRPHFTLARLKEADRQAVRAFLASPVPALAFEAPVFHLYASTLHPDGARYERLRSYPLAPGQTG